MSVEPSDAEAQRLADIDALKVHHIAPAKKKKKSLPLTPSSRPSAPEPPPTGVVRAGDGVRSTVVEKAALRDAVIESIRLVFDPEIPVNVFDLGLIYKIDVNDDGEVRVDMTLTAPACPVAGQLVADVAGRAAEAEGAAFAEVTLVWDPPWTKERMSEDALFELGLI